MAEIRIYNNKLLFWLYGVVNLLLIILLLTLLIFFINDIYILSRIGFIIFVGVHLFLVFFVKIHYVCIFYNDEKQKIEIHYNRRFGFKWQQKIRTVLLPLKQFDGYRITKDSMGISIIVFYKFEQKERYELGPFHVGFISKMEKQLMEDAFGAALR